MKTYLAIFAILFFMFVIVLVIKNTPPRVDQETIKANTIGFNNGDLLIRDNGGFRMLVEADTIADEIGIVTRVDSVDGEILIKYLR